MIDADRIRTLADEMSRGKHTVSVVHEAADALDALLAELDAWHAKCDEVGIPHDPDALVRHHRGNAGVAGAMGAMASWVKERRALLAERDTAVGAARKVLAECEALNVDLAQVEAEREAADAEHDEWIGRYEEIRIERDALRRQVAGARAFVDEYFERGDGHNLMVCLRSCLAASTSDTEPEARP